MKTSALSRSAEAAKMKKKTGKHITSIDGTKKITIEEFDRLFDEGSGKIDDFIDWSKPVVSHGGRRTNSGRKPSGRKPYQIRLKPEVHARLKKRATQKGLSISELVETLVD